MAAESWAKEGSDVMLKCVLPAMAFCVDQCRSNGPGDGVGVDELVGLVHFRTSESEAGFGVEAVRVIVNEAEDI